MNRLRTRLLLAFLAATLAPLAVTLAVTWRLLDHSLSLSSTRELDATSRALQATGRALYQTACENLRVEAEDGGLQKPAIYPLRSIASAPAEVRTFVESNDGSVFYLGGEAGDVLHYLIRDRDTVSLWSKKLPAPGMRELGSQYIRARRIVERANQYDLRRGFTVALVLLAVSVWTVSFIAVFYLARRISRPMEELTSGLRRLADGDLHARLQPKGTEEVAAAMLAFNHTAEQLRESQEKLVHVTRLSSWQSLARKMAHELKNSLTPIRLTVEEIVARRSERDQAFFEQAAQIVVDEIRTLERRVRAFSELASEPPVQLRDVDVNALLAERFALLRSAHPEVVCDARFDPGAVTATADPDIVKGLLTNLLDNAADAAGAGGVVLGRTFVMNGKVGVEVHDSGPGLSAQARLSLFEPTISFKKAGMGLGLSIARRSAVLIGGDIALVDGELGGAGFRVVLPRAGE